MKHRNVVFETPSPRLVCGNVVFTPDAMSVPRRERVARWEMNALRIADDLRRSGPDLLVVDAVPHHVEAAPKCEVTHDIERVVTFFFLPSQRLQCQGGSSITTCAPKGPSTQQGGGH